MHIDLHICSCLLNCSYCLLPLSFALRFASALVSATGKLTGPTVTEGCVSEVLKRLADGSADSCCCHASPDSMWVPCRSRCGVLLSSFGNRRFKAEPWLALLDMIVQAIHCTNGFDVVLDVGYARGASGARVVN